MRNSQTGLRRCGQGEEEADLALLVFSDREKVQGAEKVAER